MPRMRRVAPTAMLALVLALSACGTSQVPATAEPDANASVGVESGTSAVLKQAANVFYRDFADGDLATGRPVALFFHQNADPFSQRSDRLLRQWYGSGAVDVSTLRVDVGTASGMTLAFSVLLPDTFVLLNASGSKVASVLHPTAQELRSLLSR